jgi:UDP-glucose 4-epimerase
MSQVTITGGCGFIGLNLTEYLLSRTDWHIVILDNLSSGSAENLKQLEGYTPERVTFQQGDIRNQEDVADALRGSTSVVNLAAQVGVIPSIENPFEDAEINIIGLLTVLTEAAEQNVTRVVQASSAAPLGEQMPPLDEEKVPQPLSPYGASKLAGEGYCSAFAASFTLDTVALRFSNVYGPHSYTKGSVIAKFIKHMLRNEPVTIYGDGNQTRDFIHARDISHGIYLALTTDVPNRFDLFQIATGKETTVNDLYQIIKDEMERQGYTVAEPVYTPAREGEIYRNYADISKAEHMLGYTPSVPLSEGILETVEWFTQNNPYG